MAEHLLSPTSRRLSIVFVRQLVGDLSHLSGISELVSTVKSVGGRTITPFSSVYPPTTVSLSTLHGTHSLRLVLRGGFQVELNILISPLNSPSTSPVTRLKSSPTPAMKGRQLFLQAEPPNSQ